MIAPKVPDPTYRVFTIRLLAAFTLLAALIPETGADTPNRNVQPYAVPCLSSPAATPDISLHAGRTGPAMVAPANSVTVMPGSIQQAVNAHDPNTSFLLAPGVYSDGPVTPKNGDRFYGEGNAVWDGRGTQQQAFNGSATNNVLVSGIQFIHFNPPNQGTGIFNLNTGESMFVIEGCEIAYNSGTPLVVGNGTQVINSSIHDNNWVGIGGYQVSSVLVDHNEIYNNYLAGLSPDTPTGDASGLKFGKSKDVHVTNNRISGNHGIGIWFDTDNIGTLIDKNVITDNYYRGVMEEISYGATISNNIISENGRASGWIAGGGIVISTASNVEAFGNILAGNSQGIVGFQQDRGSGSQGVYLAHGNNIHDNFIAMTKGITGFTMGADADGTNRFYDNHYFLRYTIAFIWGKNTDVTGWRAVGQDQDGTFDCLSNSWVLPGSFWPFRDR
jgi:parallel beta-helix repeat protein